MLFFPILILLPTTFSDSLPTQLHDLHHVSLYEQTIPIVLLCPPDFLLVRHDVHFPSSAATNHCHHIGKSPDSVSLSSPEVRLLLWNHHHFVHV